MAISLFDGGTDTITTTERSLINSAAYDTGANSNSDGVYQLFLTLDDMTVGDELQIRFYEKVRAADTQRIVFQQILFGPQSDMWTHPALILMHAWDVTLDCIAGTSIDVDWALKKVA